jgi:predicted helicase
LGEKKLWLQDDYVKFIRFGQWRIEQSGTGVLAFITNHGYLDNPTFRGMRQQLMQTFTDIYVLDLHGNAKKKERCPDGSKDENVFDIQQGVAIGIFVKEPGKAGAARVHHADLWGVRETEDKQAGKYPWLASHCVDDTQWVEPHAEAPFYMFVPRDTSHRQEYERGWKVLDIISVGTSGIVTARDEFVIDMDESALLTRMADLRSPGLSDDAIRGHYFTGKGSPKYPPGDSRGWKLPEARKAVAADSHWRERVAPCLYRPFDVRSLYYVPWMVDWPRDAVMPHMLAGQNLALLLGRAGQVVGDIVWDLCFCCRRPADFNAFYRGGVQLLPSYLYAPSQRDDQTTLPPGTDLQPASSRRPNLRQDLVIGLASCLGIAYLPDGRGDLEATFGPEDVFHYIYAVLHSPSYRERYAEFLKTDFPRVPLTSNRNLFRALVAKGADLVALHIMEDDYPAASWQVGSQVENLRHHESLPHQSPFASLITRFPIRGENLVDKGYPRYRPPGDKLADEAEPLAAGRVYINAEDTKKGARGQYFEGVPPEVWEFHVGGYQVCDKWLKDRRGRQLSYEDLTHYQRVVVALQETIRLMGEIDAAIPGWPLE